MSHPERDRAPRWRWWLVLATVSVLAASAATYYTTQGREWFRTVGRTVTDLASPADPSASPGRPGAKSSVDQPTGVLPVPPEPPTIPAPGPSSTGVIDPARVKNALRGGLDAPALGKRVVAAVAPLSGGPAVYSAGTGAVRPASTMKVLTAIAALDALGPEHTFETRVALVGGSATPPPGDGTGPGSVGPDSVGPGGVGAGKGGPSTLVLIGGGDPLLASQPSRDDYPVRADLGALARRTATALTTAGIGQVRLRYDDSLFAGPVGSPTWPEDYLRDDIVAPITALWVDEGRSGQSFGRVDDPSAVAAQVFAMFLQRAGVEVMSAPTSGATPVGARDIASVTSPPLSQIVEHVLEVSDNEGAEVLAHHVGIAVASDGSFEGGARGVATRLSALGIPLRGAKIVDGSGLSRAARLRPETLVAALQLASRPDRPQLRSVVTGLPVAAYTGSLTYRFADGSAAGRGRVRAKTGTLTGVHGLAGIATGLDGQSYAFTIIADRVAGPRQVAARLTIDRLAAQLAACRCAVR
ncbi:MAG: D-alanyl-D-alanine carboxypeptidase/D-alanyl-D-alanine endopeptidase [Nocardioides sp.]